MAKKTKVIKTPFDHAKPVLTLLDSECPGCVENVQHPATEEYLNQLAEAIMLYEELIIPNDMESANKDLLALDRKKLQENKLEYRRVKAELKMMKINDMKETAAA